VSCEPCRLRKIRWPRDGPPCITCQRRGVPAVQCQYAVRTGSPRFASTSHQTALRPLSPCTETNSLDAHSVDNENTDLAACVQKLEDLLRRAPSLARVEVGASTDSETVDRHGQPSNAPTPTARPTPPDQLRGTLRTNEAGYMRFIPQALAWDPGLHGLADDYQVSPAVFQPGSPLGSRRTSSKSELMLPLPPQGACQELLNVYFQSFASLFHILHDLTFYRQYACFLEDPEAMPLSWIALLYAILATAILALPCDSTILSDLSRQRSPLTRSLELTQCYRDMAMRVLEADNYSWNHNVTTLQTLVILIYGISHSHGQTWTLLGLSHHLALSIGCHVDPDTLGLNAVECEERRRAWAGLMMLYTNQNSALGHVGLPHTTFKASSRPPADVNDEDVGNDALSHRHTAGEATQMTYLLLKFRLYDICADICANVLCKNAPDWDLIRQMNDMLRDERRSWEARLSQTIETMPLRVHHKAHLNVLRSYADHLIILLHQRHALDSGCSVSAKNLARSRCVESARHLLQIHASMNEMPEMTPFRWYGRGVGAFTLSMPLLYWCTSHVPVPSGKKVMFISTSCKNAQASSTA
jgi:hypothetical protein